VGLYGGEVLIKPKAFHMLKYVPYTTVPTLQFLFPALKKKIHTEIVLEKLQIPHSYFMVTFFFKVEEMRTFQMWEK
jgi:hypothetical protein